MITVVEGLKALARDRNALQKHEWRARIVLLSADGVGTNEIMRQTDKTRVWPWQDALCWKDTAARCATRPVHRVPHHSGRASPNDRA